MDKNEYWLIFFDWRNTFEGEWESKIDMTHVDPAAWLARRVQHDHPKHLISLRYRITCAIPLRLTEGEYRARRKALGLAL